MSARRRHHLQIDRLPWRRRYRVRCRHCRLDLGPFRRRVVWWVHSVYRGEACPHDRW